MYDNSSTLALSGVGVTVVGQTTGVLALVIAAVVVLLAALALKIAHGRRTDRSR